MSRRFAELCTNFVETAFGHLAAQIFSTLASRGRITLSALREHSRIPLSALKTGLAILIHQHLVLYYAPDEDEPTYYQVDWRNAYGSIRSREMISLVKDRSGEAAGQLLAHVIHVGHISVGDLAAEFDLAPESKRDSRVDTIESKTNGGHAVNNSTSHTQRFQACDSLRSENDLHHVLRALLQDGFIVKLTDRTYVPNSDLQEQIRDTLIAEQFTDGKITGPKKQREFQAAANGLKRKWREEDGYSEVRDTEWRSRAKQPDSPPPSSNKRRKPNDDLSNGTSHAVNENCRSVSRKLPNSMILRADLSRYTVPLRSQALERMVNRLLGPTTASVYSALLRAVEDRARSIRETVRTVRRPAQADGDVEDGDDTSDDIDEEMLPYATDMEVERYLEEHPSLNSARKHPSAGGKLTNGNTNDHEDAQYVDVDDDLGPSTLKREERDGSDSGSEADGLSSYNEKKRRLRLIDRHLCILAEHPKGFCIRKSGAKQTKIDVTAVTRSLLEDELYKMINAHTSKMVRYPLIGTRMVRLMRKTGKMDEKQLSEMSMMRIKEIQAILTELQFHRLVESQELPINDKRKPEESTWLYWFNEEAVRDKYLQQIYHAMTRIVQRTRCERDTVYGAVISKAKHAEAQDNNKELLSDKEKEMLHEWPPIEEELLVQLGRLDEVVAILRDFDGRDTSLFS